MRREARVLLGRHNLSAFTAADKKRRSLFRQIRRIKVDKDGGLIYIDIEADGFLYKMARNIVGTLLEIGRRRFPPGSMQRILLSRDRRQAGPTAAPKGLCLVRVRY
jgi:tRNA pseudouridine38-40 synthase